MQLRLVRLETGALHEPGAAAPQALRTLWCFHGSAGGALLSLPAGMQSLWLSPQAGPVVDTGNGMAELDRHALCWNGETPLRGYVRTEVPLTVIAWRRPLLAGVDGPQTLFSAREALGAELQRAAARLLQAGRDLPAQHWSLPLLFKQVVDAARQQQSAYTALVGRCPGRALQTREQVFQRLLRVRQQVEWATQPDFDIASMARIASYSRFHFIRIFRDVFDETPNDFLLRVRLARAEQLLKQSGLSVGEISLRLGFSGGASFARAFRRQFGTTASNVKRAGGVR